MFNSPDAHAARTQNCHVHPLSASAPPQRPSAQEDIINAAAVVKGMQCREVLVHADESKENHIALRQAVEVL